MAEEISLEQIQQKLSNVDHGLVENPFPEDFFNRPAREAAVLIPFLQRGGSWHLLFIRRTEDDNDRHAGQVAFPGGRLEEGDLNTVATALREAEEEVGILPEHVTVLGRLGKLMTISNYLVTPVVGLVTWPYPLRLAPNEVSRAFLIPLKWLFDPVNYEIGERSIPFKPGKVEVIYFAPYDGELLWGVSAKIVINLINALV